MYFIEMEVAWQGNDLALRRIYEKVHYKSSHDRQKQDAWLVSVGGDGGFLK